MPLPSDHKVQSLLSRWQTGEDVENELLAEVAPFVRSLPSRLRIVDEDAGSDFLAAIWENLPRKLKKYQPQSQASFYTWFSVVLSHDFFRWWRKQHRPEVAVDTATLDWQMGQTLITDSEGAAPSNLHALLEELPLQSLLALKLTYAMPLSGRDLARLVEARNDPPTQVLDDYRAFLEVATQLRQSVQDLESEAAEAWLKAQQADESMQATWRERHRRKLEAMGRKRDTLPGKVVASVLKTTEAAVHAALSRGKKMLKTKLQASVDNAAWH